MERGVVFQRCDRNQLGRRSSFFRKLQLQGVSPLLILLLTTAPDAVVGNAHPTRLGKLTIKL